jgi:hypothetical protein
VTVAVVVVSEEAVVKDMAEQKAESSSDSDQGKSNREQKWQK